MLCRISIAGIISMYSNYSKLYNSIKVCTVRRKILHTLSSVWSKTTLTTGDVGRAGLNPKT